jgi:polysaccharide biosynthesis protein PslH
MRILILSRLYPYPEDNGEKRRIGAFVTRLLEQHSVTLVAMQENGASSDAGFTPKIEKFLVERNVYGKWQATLLSIFKNRNYHEIRYWNNEYQTVLNKLLAEVNFDLIWVNHLSMSRYIEQYLQDIQSQNLSAPILLLDQHNVDEHDWESHYYANKNPILKFYSLWQKHKAKQLQAKWFPRYDIILSVSEADKALTRKYTPIETRAWIVSNGVDTEYFQPDHAHRKTGEPPRVVFGGSMDVRMNQDAAHWFASKIFPLIQQFVPDVQFLIVGRNPPQSISDLAKRPGVIVTGSVPDVRFYYRQADVFVIPSRMGGGTKLKTLEAMAMGLAVISTSVGVQGLDIDPGKDVLVATSPQEFADNVKNLLVDPALAIALGKSARDKVCQKYRWDTIVGKVNERMVAAYERKSLRAISGS